MGARFKRYVLFVAMGTFCCAHSAFAQTAVQATSSAPTNLQELEGEATNWLQDLLRINTTNPPGNELAAEEIFSNTQRLTSRLT